MLRDRVALLLSADRTNGVLRYWVISKLIRNLAVKGEAHRDRDEPLLVLEIFLVGTQFNANNNGYKYQKSLVGTLRGLALTPNRAG